MEQWSLRVGEVVGNPVTEEQALAALTQAKLRGWAAELVRRASPEAPWEPARERSRLVFVGRPLSSRGRGAGGKFVSLREGSL